MNKVKRPREISAGAVLLSPSTKEENALAQ
jgi:hypothetical protein